MPTAAETRVRTWNDSVVVKWYCGQRATSPAALTESPVVLRMLGDVRDRILLDAGCAGGYYAFEMHALGARGVIGIDSSENMIAYARNLQRLQSISETELSFRLGDVTELAGHLLAGNFHGAVCTQLLNNVDNYFEILASLNRALKPGGVLVVVVPHPLSTAQEKAPRVVDGCAVVSDWNRERKIVSRWRTDRGWISVESWHRPSIAYENALIANGFKIVELAEPQVPEGIQPRSEIDIELIERRKRIPSALIIKAVKERELV